MTKTLSLSALVVSSGLLLGLGCTTELAEVGPTASKPDAQKAIPWSRNDDPNLFSGDLEYKVGDLPREGQAERTPWAASYWPYYQDSINFKWDGSDSDAPSTKYGKAFGVDGVEDAVSRMRGVDGQASRTECTATSDCDDDLGEECAKREGAETGRCIPTWFGICHAWAPASILVPEPKYPVTLNDVEFKVNDIKALVTLAHDRVVNRFASGRCNENDGADDIEYDEFGRPKPGECIDTNPATFHILVANYLGLQGASFVYDRTYDWEVWNQPIREYRVTHLEEVDALTANTLIGVQSTGGESVSHDEQHVDQNQMQQFDSVAVKAGDRVVVSTTGTGDVDLYVRFGQAPSQSDYDCRPFESGSDESCELTAPEGASELFVAAHGYSASDFSVNINVGGGAPDVYQFNNNARKFYEVRLEVDFIAESDSATDGHLADAIDRYTHTDRYHYILEEGDDGKLVGGEWLGDSKRAHPDFLWLPVREGQSTVAEGKITFANVMRLLNLSITEPGTGEEGPRVIEESGSVDRNQLVHFGPFSTTGEFTVHMTGTGDADLYVRKNAAPALTAYDCRPYKNGSQEDCAVAGPGQFYVAVHGYKDSTFNLEITFESGELPEEPEEPEEPTEPGETVHLNESGDVANGAMVYFTLDLNAGETILVRTQAPNDIDVYLREGAQPTTSEYSAHGYTASGNETVRFQAGSATTLHIGVHGYEASAFTLTTEAL